MIYQSLLYSISTSVEYTMQIFNTIIHVGTIVATFYINMLFQILDGNNWVLISADILF